MKKLLLISFVVLVAASWAFAQTTTVNNTLSVTVGAEAALQITAPGTTTPLTTALTTFGDYTGTTTFTYWIRTKQSGGSGAITVQAAQFSGTGAGPVIPGVNGDTLSFISTVNTPGSSVTSTTVASTSIAYTVSSFGAGAHSATTGTAGNTVSWDLTNDPAYQTGTYTSVVLWTISAS